MSEALDKILKFQSASRRKLEVSELDLIIWYSPFTAADSEKVETMLRLRQKMRKINKEDEDLLPSQTMDRLVATLIVKAEDKKGNRLFASEEMEQIKKAIPAKLLIRIITEMQEDLTPEEELEGNANSSSS